MTAAELVPSRGALAVWRRHVLVWRQLFWPSMASNVFEPLLFLFAFGFGLGAIVGELGEVPYLVFIVPGVMAYTAMFAASFESTISAYARFQMQRTWDAQLATPLSLTDVLAGELLWATSKAMIASSCVLVVGWLWGGIPSPGGALLGLGVLALAAFCFGAVGICATAFARNWDFYNYFFTFWVTPMFIFSGVFFEVERFPDPVQALAWVLPMTHTVAVLRPLTLGAGLELLPAIGHLAYLVVMAGVAFAAARWRAGQRMFD
ncbi:MAG TPA: ABC transporter permease [Geminicoccaceae bacterium]